MINWPRVGKMLLFCFGLMCFWGLVEQAKQINRMGYAIQELQTSKNEMDIVLNRQETINHIFKEYLFKLLEENNLRKLIEKNQKQNKRNEDLRKNPENTILCKI